MSLVTQCEVALCTLHSPFPFSLHFVHFDFKLRVLDALLSLSGVGNYLSPLPLQ